MTLVDRLGNKVKELERIAEDIEKLGVKMLEENTFDYHPPTSGVMVVRPRYSWKIPDSNVKQTQREAIRKYQAWFAASSVLIRDYLPQQEDEFVSSYNAILSYLQFDIKTWEPKNEVYVNQFVDLFVIQRGIVMAVPGVVEMSELELRGLISGDLIDDELDEADHLFESKHFRAAGAVAGVAIERFLKTMCETSTPPVQYKKKDTINPLAVALYKAGRLDKIMLTKIQHLASIRNKCDHAEDVSDKEVEELIREVRALTSK